MSLVNIDLGYAAFALLFGANGLCYDAPEIWRWARGKHLNVIKFYAEFNKHRIVVHSF